MKTDELLATWIRFCKACCPGSRLWVTDEDYERLALAIEADMRYMREYESPYRIDYRGGYMNGGVSFYRKSVHALTRSTDR